MVGSYLFVDTGIWLMYFRRVLNERQVNVSQFDEVDGPEG